MDWQLTTTDGTSLYSTSYRAIVADLRHAVPASAAAFALAVLAWILRRRLPLAVAIATSSTVLSAQVLPLGGVAVLGSGSIVVALLCVAIWLAQWPPKATAARVVFVAVPVAVSGAWLIGRFALPSVFDIADLAADATMASGLVAIAVGLADRARWRGRLLTLGSTRVTDLLAVAFLIAVSVIVGLIIEAPSFLLVALALGLLVLYPRFRRRTADLIDVALLGDVRDRAGLRAVEDERGRIARDLHDEPLQEIAAVIRQLDQRPGTRAESDLLRQAAGHIRRVTTELRPPVLDDLGLRAAIAFVADHASAKFPHVKVMAAIVPDDPLADRPPRDVELAIFRIVQEAVDNACRHANAETVSINATVTATDVLASVEDDGQGLSESRSRAAMLEGHVGLASMAQRAALINGSFEIANRDPRGTIVSIHWKAGQ